MPPHPIFCSQVLINTIHLLREVYSQSNQIQPAEGRDGRKASDCQAQSPRIFSHCWGGLSSTCFYDLELLFEMQVAPVYVKPDTAAIHERIGFDPKPKLQWKKNKDTLWVEDFLSLSRYLLVAMMWLKWCLVDSCSTFGFQNRTIPPYSDKEPFQAFNDIGPAKIVKKSRNWESNVCRYLLD